VIISGITTDTKKMAKLNVHEVKEYSLTLNEDEMAFLYTIVRSCAGKQEGLLKVVNDIYDAITDTEFAKRKYSLKTKYFNNQKGAQNNKENFDSVPASEFEYIYLDSFERIE
jgi:hypothetical protein